SLWGCRSSASTSWRRCSDPVEGRESSMTRIALFDMDKTLVRKDTAGLYIRYEYDIGRASLWRVARVFGWRVRYTLGWLPAEQVAQRVLGWYTGREVAELRRENQSWARTY